MRQLFTIDKKDYDPNDRRTHRPSVRAVIIRGDKLETVHSLKFDYYKFPGGGIEPGESHVQALVREVLEESGLRVIESSVREYGCVRRVQRGRPGEIFDQENFYYFCDVLPDKEEQKLDDYEADERFTPELVSPRRAADTNFFAEHHGKDPVLIEREARVLEMLIAEGYFEGND